MAFSAQASEAITRRIAKAAVDDAREAWKRARVLPTADHVRAAHRLCVYAARTLRRAEGATGSTDDGARMAEAAERLDAAAADLNVQLSRFDESIEPPRTIKRIGIRVNPSSPQEILADFHLDGDEVVAIYHDESFRQDVERGLVFVERALRPSDGRAFFDALESGLANSSRITVTAIPARSP